MTHYLEFEKPLAEIEGKANELRALARTGEGMDVEKEAAALTRGQILQQAGTAMLSQANSAPQSVLSLLQ